MFAGACHIKTTSSSPEVAVRLRGAYGGLVVTRANFGGVWIGAGSSSSRIVSVTGDAVANTFGLPLTIPDTVTVLFTASSTSLFTAVIVTVPVLVVAPLAIVRVIPFSSKSAATAGDTASAVTVTVNSAGAGEVEGTIVAVTVLTPPFSAIVSRSNSSSTRSSVSLVASTAFHFSTRLPSESCNAYLVIGTLASPMNCPGPV